MKWPLIISILFLAGSLSAQVKYAPEDFSNVSKVSKKIAKTNAKNIVKHDVKKIVITEFFGEFVTSKETSPSAFEKRHSNWYVEKKSTLEMGSDYYESLTNQIYNEVVRVFEENGIEVLDKDILLENQDYIALGLKEEKTGRQYSGGVGKQSTTSEVIKRSVTGMGMYSETLKIGAVVKINEMIPNIAQTNDCQGAIQVKFRVGLGKKGTPTLDYIKVVMDSNLAEYNAGKGRTTYAFKNGGVELFNTLSGLINEADISGEEKGSVDITKYNASIMGMVKGMCDAYSYQLSESLPTM